MRLSAIFFVSLLASVSSTGVSSAQASDVGLTVAGGGLQAGAMCRAVRCQAIAMRVPAGTTWSVSVWGPPGSSYILALGAPTTTCVRIPGLSNQLMLGAPLLAFRTGTIGRPNRIVVCNVGEHSGRVNIPRNASGARVHLQALARIGARGGPAFTPTVAINVQ